MERERFEVRGRLRYSSGFTAGREGFRRIIRNGDFILRRGDDLFVPALWCSTRTIMAYSAKGYIDRDWVLPADWADVRQVDVFLITLTGLKLTEHNKIIDDGKIQLSLERGQAVAFVPVD
jgi:hypothetical protein